MGSVLTFLEAFFELAKGLIWLFVFYKIGWYQGKDAGMRDAIEALGGGDE